MARTPGRDSIGAVAMDVVERIHWEMEHGVSGYPAFEGELPEVVLPKQSPAVPREEKEMPVSSEDGSGHDSPSVTLPEGVAVGRYGEDSQTTKSPYSPFSKGKPSISPFDKGGRGDFQNTSDSSAAKEIAAQETLTESDPAVSLAALQQAIGDCKRCLLCKERTHLVFGEGNPRARLVFVGEGPGKDEDLAGRPFVGAAGQLLDRIIEAMGTTRNDVYICNVVKCRPPNNRTPEESERRICGPFLHRQLSVIHPEAVVALGSTAAQYLLNTQVPVSRLRGAFHTIEGLSILATYHPAYLLRTPSAKRAVWTDMQMVMAKLGLKPKEKG